MLTVGQGSRVMFFTQHAQGQGEAPRQEIYLDTVRSVPTLPFLLFSILRYVYVVHDENDTASSLDLIFSKT